MMLVVYFVRLDEKDADNLGNKIVQSNYVRGDYAYIINVQPGKYAAIASYFTHNDICHNTFYDAAIINSTVIEVGPNQVVFAGQLFINNKMKTLYRNIEVDGDKAQLYYYNMLKKSMTGYFYRGTFNTAGRSKEFESEFLNKTKEYFKNTEWDSLIEKSIKAIDNN